jgi:hypothetical protein
LSLQLVHKPYILGMCFEIIRLKRSKTPNFESFGHTPSFYINFHFSISFVLT